MVPTRRILFPTDFSESADHAWSFALRFAQAFGAEIHLLHVVAPPPRMTEAYAANFDEAGWNHHGDGHPARLRGGDGHPHRTDQGGADPEDCPDAFVEICRIIQARGGDIASVVSATATSHGERKKVMLFRLEGVAADSLVKELEAGGHAVLSATG